MRLTRSGWLILQAGCCLGLALIAGCHSLPTNIAALNRARSDYAAAKQDATVRLLAKQEMRLADEAMEEADRSWARNEAMADTEHRAYILKQRVLIARMSATLACKK